MAISLRLQSRGFCCLQTSAVGLMGCVQSILSCLLLCAVYIHDVGGHVSPQHLIFVALISCFFSIRHANRSTFYIQTLVGSVAGCLLPFLLFSLCQIFSTLLPNYGLMNSFITLVLISFLNYFSLSISDTMFVLVMLGIQ